MVETPKFDARLKEGVAYFDQMLKVMPDDRTTLEFLAVAYPQMGELDKAEEAVASLARVLLKEGDVESATALLPRLEECSSDSAKAMVLKVRAAIAPRPELTPETPTPMGLVATAAESEAKLAAELGEAATADYVIVMDEGKIALSGTPREVFTKVDTVRALGLDVPPMTDLAHMLRADGLDVRADVLTVDEMVEEVCRLSSSI